MPDVTLSTDMDTFLITANDAAAVNELGGATSTGTGGLVRITSPTLVTPALGTPSALVLTNATGLPTTALTGALQAAQEPAHTGDVTNSAGSLAMTIAVGAVTDIKASLAVKPAVMAVATSNLALTGEQTIDGQLSSASLVLLSAQTAGAENGPWITAAGAWARPTWYPAGGTTQAFQFITAFVRLGTTYQGTMWRMTTAGAITINTTATVWTVTPHALNASTVVGTLPTANLPANQIIATVGITVDGGGSAITTGVKGYIQVLFAGTITANTVLADQSGSIVFDIWKDTYANYPPVVGDTITASAKPTISATNKSTDATLTGWTTSVSTGDVLGFNVDSCATITRATLELKMTRT